MKVGDFLKKLLKFLFYLVLVLALGALDFWVVWHYQLPLWVGWSLLATAAGFLLLFLIFRRFRRRRQQKKLIRHMVTDAPGDAGAVGSRDHLEELRNHWSKALLDLKRSRLRQKGNPLKVVPWFLILGESRGGKTTAIKHSFTSSPLTEVRSDAQASGTRNCDWWFCDQAVILDTAGRYAVPLSEERDLEEWQVFLELLEKARRQPLQGVIVTVAADRLLAENFQELRQKGGQVRQRLNQLMGLVGDRFPVYLLVTKMDLVHGFTDFFDHFPAARMEASMGLTNSDPERSWQEVVDETFSTLLGRLRQLRLILAHNADLRTTPGAVQFPNEFRQLREPLAHYTEGALGFDRYLETPFVRGVYFSSGERQGHASSAFSTLIAPTLHRGGPGSSRHDS